MRVASIVAAVRERGDDALAECAQRFGDPVPRRVTAEEIACADEATADGLRGALHGAAERIEAFARAQRASLRDTTVKTKWGVMGSRFVPIECVGVYVPGGRYPLVSTLLMCAIPARVAGVSRIVVCTPKVNDAILAAASVAGISDLYEAGGAQAIAAMACGTRLIPRVDLIVGPGNAYVAEAKRLVYGEVGIDALAGPSELMIIASADAEARIIAADMLAQAEHDPDARAQLVTNDRALVDAVRRELDAQLHDLPTAEIARASLQARPWWRVVTLDRAVRLANECAPEHVQLQGRDAEALAPQLRNYGSLFVGRNAAESFADYGIGPNHVLPTSGSARFSSGLSVLTFLNCRTYVEATSPPSEEVIEQTEALARIEGLRAHERSATLRTT